MTPTAVTPTAVTPTAVTPVTAACSAVAASAGIEPPGVDAAGVDTAGVDAAGIDRTTNRRSAAGETRRGEGDARVTRVWREWLTALAKDPEAALAAAQAYEQLDDAARERWLSILDKEGASLEVPRVALYAPMLAVESNPQRLLEILGRVAAEVQSATRQRPTDHSQRRALCGDLGQGVRLAVLVEPLYLDFVHVLACAYVPGRRFVWVRHDPIANASDVVSPGGTLECVRVDATPVKAVVDELARTIVAHQRGGEPLPEPLRCFADFFGIEDGVSAEPPDQMWELPGHDGTQHADTQKPPYRRQRG